MPQTAEEARRAQEYLLEQQVSKVIEIESDENDDEWEDVEDEIEESAAAAAL